MHIQNKLKNKNQASAKLKKNTGETMVVRIVIVAEILAKVVSETGEKTHN